MIEFFEKCTDNVLAILVVLGGFLFLGLVKCEPDVQQQVSSWVYLVIAFYFGKKVGQSMNGGNK